MKKMLIFLLILINSAIQAATYYVSSSGNDSNSGLSTLLPWKTISKVNTIIYAPGDQILFKCGDTFYGTIVVSGTGNSSLPVTYSSYGSGNKPVITGFTTITGWTNEGNGIYSKVISSEDQSNMVTIDGIQYGMGRYPNSTYLKYESASTNVSITDNELTGTPNWTGAEAVIRKNTYSMVRTLITNHSGSTLTYTALVGTLNATANYGYFIQNDLRTLDQFGEWYHDAVGGKFYMYFGATDPTTKVVKVATLNLLISNSTWKHDYITIDNISISGCIKNAIDAWQWYNNNMTVQNCDIYFAGEKGINLRSRFGKINNNIISDCNLNGIYNYNNRAEITNNQIRNVGIIKGQGIATGIGITISTDSVIVSNNVIENIGYDGIFIGRIKETTVKNNFINNTCLVLSDGGAIYTDGNHTNLLIDGNIITNVIGNVDGTPSGTGNISEGIYLDEYCNGTTVQNNSVSSCAYSGLKLHRAHDNLIQNNTFYDNKVGVYILSSEANVPMVNNTINGNKFMGKTVTQLCVFFQTNTTGDTSFGTANNNYYARPIDDNVTFMTYQPSVGTLNKTLAQWQTFSSQDANSQKSPKSISTENDLSFYYNDTKISKTISIPNPSIDITGNRYSTEIILQPFTSIVLIKDGQSYHVSSSGNDSNDGLTELTPWQTLSKVNATSFSAGSNILFKKGDTFYGSLTISQSGNSTSPITIESYGTGVNPIITGFTTVSAWTNLGSNIWESTNAVSTLSNCNMVSVNGVNTPMGRYPNIGYFTFQSHVSTTSITSSSLTGTPNWTGATAVVRTSDYTLDKSTAITSQSGSTINFTLPVYEPTNGWGFFIQNDSRTLDSSNEWYYNPSTKKIQVYSATQPTNVKVASVTNLLTISGDYVTINGIDFTGANGSGIYNQTAGIDHVTITNCNVSFSGGDGIKFRGDYSTIENNTVYYSNNDGMAVYYLKNSTVRNNVIQNSGVIPGMGNNGISSCYGIDAYETGGTLFEYNKIINSGYIGISFYGNSVVVKNNLVDTFNSILQDGGGIYTSVGGDAATTGCVISGNIVINGIGAIAGTTSGEQAHGIYLDDYCKNFEVYGNTSANNRGRGIFLHNNNLINLHDNTTFNNVGELLLTSYALNATNSSNTITGNKFISASSSNGVVEYAYTFDDWTAIGTFNNNYYARPLANTTPITIKTPTISWVNYTVANWANLSSQDANSKQSLQTITSANDLQFEYNATSTGKIIYPNWASIDATGKEYRAPVILQPFTSLVLIKDYTPPYFIPYGLNGKFYKF